MDVLYRLIKISASFGTGKRPDITTDADVIIRVRNFGRPESRFYCYLDHVYEKGNGALIGIYGNGTAPEEAMKQYLEKITGKTLICDKGSRKEVFVI